MHDLVELGLVDLRALLGCRIERVAQLAALVHRHELVDQLVVDLLLDEQPAAGAAALPLVEIQAEVRAGGGGVEIGVGEDDVRALAAQLERQPFQRLAASRMMIWAVLYSPVNATLSTPRCLTIAAPAVGP